MEIVVVGGSASNVGKTTLAARLIGRRRADHVLRSEEVFVTAVAQ